MKSYQKYLVAGVIGLTFASTALAYGHGKDDEGKRCEMKHNKAQRQEMREKRLEKLHAKLNLSEQQESAWKAFTKKPEKQVERERPDREAMKNMTTPERMDMSLAKMGQMLEKMTKRVEEVKTFYAQLTPEQQAVFDKEFRSHRGGKGGHHKGERGEMRSHYGER